MKRLLLAFILLSSYKFSQGQAISAKSIEDSVLGWMKVYNFKGAKTGMNVDGKIYSPVQMSFCDSVANWMQASYIPKGGLGDIKRSVSGKIGLYNKNDAALPPSYGAYASTYSQLKYGPNKKLLLLTSDAIQWTIMANTLVGVPVDIICTPGRHYFTLPSVKEYGISEDDPQLQSIASHPNTKQYPVYVMRNSNSMLERALLLYPQNEFPFVKITKGEYLRQIGEAVERKYSQEKREAIDKWFTDATRATARKYADDRYAKRTAVLNSNKEKYKNELNTVAEIFSTDPDILLENYTDVFTGTGGGSLKLPVYKIDSLKAEKCKTDKPQWVIVFWNGGMTQPVGKHQHESIVNNFNFEYLYNFCFYPAKVSGKPYKPLRSPDYKETIVIKEASEKSRMASGDASTFFFDDFSTSPAGQKPPGWKATLSLSGTTPVVKNAEGLNGNWVELKGHKISATDLKKPLPQDFTFSYDIAVPEKFTWGAKGLTMSLSKETSPGNAESFIKLKLRPGSGSNDGETTLETKFPSPPGYSNGTKWYGAPGFSNNKKINRITITVKKSGERLQVYIDKTKIAEYEKAIPVAHLFNALSFDSGGNSADTDKYYISNIKITKE